MANDPNALKHSAPDHDALQVVQCDRAWQVSQLHMLDHCGAYGYHGFEDTLVTDPEAMLSTGS